jgi:hypothetical protein
MDQAQLTEEQMVKRASDVQQMMNMPGWRHVMEYFNHRIDQLNNLKSMGKMHTNEIVVEVRQRQTRISVYEELLGTLKVWVSKGTKIFNKKERQQNA